MTRFGSGKSLVILAKSRKSRSLSIIDTASIVDLESKNSRRLPETGPGLDIDIDRREEEIESDATRRARLAQLADLSTRM
jgi:hypothetical protein